MGIRFRFGGIIHTAATIPSRYTLVCWGIRVWLGSIIHSSHSSLVNPSRLQSAGIAPKGGQTEGAIKAV